MGRSEKTDRTSVKTYLPRYQKERWVEHAEELGMSQSEFVRTMVQAGRRGFTDGRDDPVAGDDGTPEEEGSGGADPRGDDLERRVVGILTDEAAMEWNELVAAVTENVEDRLEDALSSLQDRNRVRHSGRHGGYVLTDDE